jgi:hypothetical protein
MFNRLSHSTFSIILTLSLLIFTGLSIKAQSNLGTITGTVFDSNGAVIPGAQVTVINLGTNRTFSLVTSEEGSYTLPNLEPVTYRVEATAQGFSSTIMDKVKVDTAMTAKVDITLQPGAPTESIVVTGEGMLINTDTGAQGATITEKMITDLPVAERNVLQLALTIPNVSGFVGTEDPDYTGGIAAPGAGLNINGGRPGESSILADGVTNTGASIARQVVSFSPEVVQEVTVQTSSFSAEYGRTGGGIINTTTKSGSNEFHGLISWFSRNPSLNAKDYNPGQKVAPRDQLRENRGSLTVGGPVFLPRFGEGGKPYYSGRNRTFFFFAFEPRWRTDGEAQYSLLPDAGMRRGDFSNVVRVPGGYVRRDVANRLGIRPTGDFLIYDQFNLNAGQFTRRALTPTNPTFPQFQNNVIPSEYLDPVSQQILQYMPEPGDYFILNGQVRNYVGDRHVNIREKRWSLKIDHRLTDSNQLSVRYTTVPIFGEKGRGKQTGPVVNANVSDYSASKQVLISDTHMFSPTLINTLNLNYTKGLYDRTVPMEWQGRSLSRELGLPSGTGWGLPQFNTGPFTIGLAGSLNNINVGVVKNQEQTYNINNVLAKTAGNMTWKFGVNLEQQEMANSLVGTFQGGDYGFSGSFTNSALTGGSGGDSFATFLLGIPTSLDLRTSSVSYKYRWRSMDLFVQNDWKIRPNLTLNLGLRYSLDLPRVERNNLQGYFDLDRSIRATIPDSFATQLQTTYPGFPVHMLPKETLIPAFAFVGRDGRSPYLQPVDSNNFMPRIGVAWSPHILGFNSPAGRQLVIRAGYGLSYLPLRGDNRRPVPDLGGQNAAGYNALSSGLNPNNIVRMGTNPPFYRTADPLLGIPENGLITMSTLSFGVRDAFAISPMYQIPKTHNWSAAIEFGLMRNTALELTYQGNYSNTLFFPPTSVNPSPFDYIEELSTANINPSSTIPDPFGRRDAQGRVINVSLSTLSSPFLGFGAINERYRADSVNFRNAFSAYLKRRLTSGLATTIAYTFGKTLNTSSDAGTDNVGFSRTINQSGYGTPFKGEYGVADFDITHTFSSTFLYEMPFGSRRRFLRDSPAIINNLIGGWTISGVFTANSGLPVKARLQDPNGLSGGSGSVRPNLNTSEPLLNPLWRRDCPFGEGCEPYLNPAAFYRPPKGVPGDAPRTIGWARYPGRSQLDLSLQKDFYIFGSDSRKRLQFRVDAINALNQVNFRFDGNNAFNWSVEGGGGYPNEADISPTEFNNWIAAHPQLGLRPTPTAVNAVPTAEYLQVLAITRNARTGADKTRGPLPANFFSVPIPQGFASRTANNFDIRTPEGLKLYRLRNSFDAAQFGRLSRAERMRVVTFSLRFYF